MAIVETVNVKNLSPIEEECIIQDFFRQAIITVRAADRPVAHKAREVRRQNKKVTPTDAVHVATAIPMGCDALLTTDGINPKGGSLLQLDKKIDNLRIQTPEQYLDGRFPHLNGSYSLVAR